MRIHTDSGSGSKKLLFTRVLAAAKLEQARSDLTRWTLEALSPPPNDLQMIHYNEDSVSQYTQWMEPADQNALFSIQNADVTLSEQNRLPFARKSAPPRNATFLKYFIPHFVNR
jgi:hypothetical protein